MLTKSNYSLWDIKIRVNFQTQRVWGVIRNEDAEEWKDGMVLTGIYQVSLEEMLFMLIEKDTVKERWNTLKVMHVDADQVKEAKV